MTRLPTTATALAAALLGTAAKLPVWVVGLAAGLTAAAVVLQFVIQYRQARAELAATTDTLAAARDQRRRLAQLEDETVYAARAIPDPAERADILLSLVALHHPACRPALTHRAWARHLSPLRHGRFAYRDHLLCRGSVGARR